MAWAVVFVALIVCALWWFKRSRIQGAVPERVAFDEDRIVRHLSNGEVETIAWDDIDRIVIVTTNEGPWNEDVWWVFEDTECSTGCLVGNGAEGFSELLERVQALPGFLNDAVIEAMGCTDNNRFVVWSRSNDAGRLPRDRETSDVI